MMRRLSTRITILLLTKWDDLGLTWIDVFGGYGMYIELRCTCAQLMHVRLSARHHMCTCAASDRLPKFEYTL